MNEQFTLLLENYKDGVPVKIERTSIIWLAAAALLVVTISALIIKLVKQI